jgi:hypothetical protein
MKFDLEYILWLDAHSQDEWTHDLDCKPVMCATVGILIKETDDCVSITHTKQVETDGVCCTIHIPKVCIVDRKKLTAIVDG